MFTNYRSSSLNKLTYLVLALALLFGGLGMAAQPAQAGSDDAPACAEYHIVQRGEYLSMIAKEYGTSWQSLAEINELEDPTLIYPNQKLCVELSDDGTGEPVIPVTGSAPSLSVLSVVKGKSVTIQAVNYPAYSEFRVLMDKIGTKAVDGIRVGTATANKDGAFKASFDIPDELLDQSLIAIRIEATGRSGHYAYNWFQNATTSVPGLPSSGPISSGSAALTIASVVEDTSITLKASNLPAYSSYIVWFDRLYGQSDVTGIKAGTVTTGRDGSLNATVRIPKEMYDRSALAVRLQSTSGSGNLISNWFSNATSENGIGGGAPYAFKSGIPAITIVEVNEGDSVKISGVRFPAKKELTVLMGKLGTQGLNGVEVDTVKTEKDGSFTATFKIPKELRDGNEIAVRVQDGSGYYAYNWFDND
jgi:LysM repeat protein